jgi:hypothetical protein
VAESSGPSSVALRFDRSLYAERGVRAAVEAFSRFARLSVSADEAALVVTVSEPDPRHADVLADELANYALTETVTSWRSGEDAPAGGTP